MKNSATSLGLALAIASTATYQHSEAFAPVHHSAGPRLAAPSQVVMDSASATALHANLVDRFTRVVNANLTDDSPLCMAGCSRTIYGVELRYQYQKIYAPP